MALNIADLFEHAADVFPERTALACGDKQFTFREVDGRANRLAHYLADLGVRPGDHVGVSARNSVEAAETLIAVCKLRAVAININYRYVENELRYLLTDSDPVALVYDRQDTARVAAVADTAAGLLGMVIIDDGSEADLGTAISYDDALAAGAPDRDFGERSSDDVYIIYTGGTTGLPKGVMWRHEDIWRTLGGGIDFITGEMLADEWEQSRRGQESAGMVRLCTAPLIHGAAQVATLGALFSGDTVVLTRKFDPHEVWRDIERHKVNVMMVIGDAMARPLIEAYHEGGYDASSLVSLSSSAALFSPVVKDACAAALPNVFITEAIGSTETGFAGIGLVQAGAEHRGGPTVSIGPEVVVLTEQGGLAGPGEVGKLARGGHVPLGYYKDPVKTAAMFAEVNGKRYAVPGDWARIEPDGAITLLGRGNTCVNTGGEKVFPEEVEGALKSHPAVFDALVIGVPDETLGQRVAALVQAREDTPVDLDQLISHVRAEIAGYKVPRSIWLVDSIGRTAAGKADYGWAQRYVADHPPSVGRPAAPASLPTKETRADPAVHLLGIEHPIVGFTPSEQVAAAISRAGGLGVLGCVRFNDPAELDAVLHWMDGNTDGRPYGVDVVMPARVPAEGAPVDLGQLIPEGHKDFVEQTLLKLGVPPLPDGTPAGDGVLGWLHSVARQHVEVALAHPARLIANALGPPPADVIERAHDRGMLVAALAGKADHARSHVASGVDIVVAQGYEAGGHTGEIASMVLIPEIVDAVGGQVPVLAAGGIGCGRQIAAALALGAVGVWMGSAWLITEEYSLSAALPALRTALLTATSSDTVRSRIYSGKPARLLKNRWTQAWTEPGAPEPLPMPLQNLLVSEAHQRLMRSGQPDVQPMPVGQIVGRMTEVRPVAELVKSLVQETAEALSRLDTLR